MLRFKVSIACVLLLQIHIMHVVAMLQKSVVYTLAFFQMHFFTLHVFRHLFRHMLLCHVVYHVYSAPTFKAKRWLCQRNSKLLLLIDLLRQISYKALRISFRCRHLSLDCKNVAMARRLENNNEVLISMQSRVNLIDKYVQTKNAWYSFR